MTVQATKPPFLAFQVKSSVDHDSGAELLAEADKLGIFDKEKDVIEEAAELGINVDDVLFKPSAKLEARKFQPSQDHTGRPTSAHGQASKAKLNALPDKKLPFHVSFSQLKTAGSGSDSDSDIDD